MSDSPEKLQHELAAARRAVVELQAQLERHEAGHRTATSELGENRSALLFMLEDLEAERNKIDLAHREWVDAMDAVNDPIFLHDKEFRILRCNKAYQQCAGIPSVQITGQPYYEVFPKTGAPLPSCLRAMEKALAEEEHEELAAGGAIYRSRSFSVHDEQGAHLYSVHILEDVTERHRAEKERKQAEAAIQIANRALATLSAVNHTLVHVANEDGLLQAICQTIVEHGYRMAWVGYAQHDESKSIKVIAHAGHDEGYLDGLQLTWAETEHGMGPNGLAIRSGATQVCQDISSDSRYLPWRDTALQRGYASSIALPLSNRNVSEVFGILNVYAEEMNAFSPGEIFLLEEMAGDLAFGVNSLHTRQERDLALEKNQQQLVQLRDSLESTVRAIATIVEMRDPYTAGHQVRVADLAAAIARQMGLPDEQVQACHLAGVVHDLGKIKIPAEILSMPGRITDIEYSLIKIHPQAGHDILKGISFPWPIAKIVLQHHEHIDGSGYPQGLKGDAILLEARILCVADVVEAMYSHRPYRPGLGLNAALQEIAMQSGIYYDPVVVDACQALFREKHYTLA